MNFESRFRNTRNQQNDETTISEKASLYKRIHDYLRNEIIFYFDLRSNEHYDQYVYKKKTNEIFERQLCVKFHDQYRCKKHFRR